MDVRTQFHTDLVRLARDTETLGVLVADAIEASLRQLMAGDRGGAERLIEHDSDLNGRRYAIEREALTLIATQQPVARDMRRVAALIDIAGELERIGDYAKGISEIQLKLDAPMSPQVQSLLHEMAQLSAGMLRRSMVALDGLDVDEARRLIAEDDRVDDLFKQVFSHVMQWEGRGEAVLERANYVLWMAHNLERTADRVTNICERILFTTTGELGGPHAG